MKQSYKLKTAAEQRQGQAHRQLLALGLEAHLRLLVFDILAGDKSKLTEFQQAVQYAPPEMKLRLMDLINAEKAA